MRKILGWLAVGLVVAVATIFWQRPTAFFPEHSRSSPLAAGTDPVLAREHAAIMQRVAALEEQMNRRTLELASLNQRVSEATASDAGARLLAQRLAANAGGGAGAPPGVMVQVQGERQELPGMGPGGSRLTVESVAAAAAAGQPVSAPPNLLGLEAKAGQVLVFRVTGAAQGSVWGSDIYTDDSSIAAAAVHSGVLRPGETGTLMLTLQAGNESYPAVLRNGIASMNFGAWDRGYVIQRLN